MRYLKVLALVGISLFSASYAHAQRVVVGFGVGPGYVPPPVYVGPPPDCRYGYYDYSPYACAPYGYYGPEWFSGGFFIGAGPWNHGYYGRRFYDRGFRRDFDDRWHGFGEHERGFGRGEHEFDRREHGFGGRGDFRGGESRGGSESRGFRGGDSRGGYSHGGGGSSQGNFHGEGGSHEGGSSHGGGGHR